MGIYKSIIDIFSIQFSRVSIVCFYGITNMKSLY